MVFSNKYKATAVLAVFNSEKTINSCLETLLKQTVPIEIIVVDDGSTDNTLAIIKTYKKIKVLRQNHQGPAVARNLGASHANSKILLFVDADMAFDSNYVKDLIQPINDGKTIGTYTAREMVANWSMSLARCWNWQEGWAPKTRFPAKSSMLGTDFRAILKKDFDRVGGFDNIGYTDTWSLFHKLGVRPLSTQAICYHKNPDRYQQVFRQARWTAKRPYKMGVIGALYALLRTSVVVSIFTGPFVAAKYQEPTFILFKFVYDWGRFVGILEMLLLGKLAK